MAQLIFVTQKHTGGTRLQRDRLCPYYMSRLCPYQSDPTGPSRVMIIRKGFKSKIKLYAYDLKLSQINRAVSWSPLVTVVPVLQRQRSRLCPAMVTAVPVPQTREIVMLWVLCLYICCPTGIEMLMKGITQYRDPSMWRIEALVHPATQTTLCSRDVVCRHEAAIY